MDLTFNRFIFYKRNEARTRHENYQLTDDWLAKKKYNILFLKILMYSRQSFYGTEKRMRVHNSWQRRWKGFDNPSRGLYTLRSQQFKDDSYSYLLKVVAWFYYFHAASEQPVISMALLKLKEQKQPLKKIMYIIYYICY